MTRPIILVMRPTFAVSGVFGFFLVDVQTGDITHPTGGDPAYKDYVRVDVHEWCGWHGLEPNGRILDVSDVAVITRSGLRYAPDYNWRAAYADREPGYANLDELWV